jgi:hypothetical protein
VKPANIRSIISGFFMEQDAACLFVAIVGHRDGLRSSENGKAEPSGKKIIFNALRGKSPGSSRAPATR